MKKQLLTFFLIVLGTSVEIYAQTSYDLDFTNCSYTIDVTFDDGSGGCNPCIVTGTTINANGIGNVFSCQVTSGQAYKVKITNGCSNFVILSDQISTGCSSSNVYSANLPTCGACLLVTVTFTPCIPGSTNAQITLN